VTTFPLHEAKLQLSFATMTLVELPKKNMVPTHVEEMQFRVPGKSATRDSMMSPIGTVLAARQMNSMTAIKLRFGAV
jgi:hypothetical protein